jgi:23S rRNA (uracil1939-C5)-methyltransferase
MENLLKNQIYTAEIESYTSEGYGVCRINGRAVFIPGTIKGEIWEILIVKVSHTSVYGKGIRLIVASSHRIPGDCPHFPVCGSCTLRHMDYEEELNFKLDKVNQALERIGGQRKTISEITGSEILNSYRNKAVFSVSRASNGDAAFGYYRSRSHDLISIQNCLLQSELCCRAAESVVSFLNRNHIPPYNEEERSGSVRHLFFRESRNRKEAVLCIVSARGFGSLTEELIHWIRKDCPELTGIVLNINKTQGNIVLFGDFYTLWGNPNITDTLCGIEYEIAPQAFFQINPSQTEKLYRQALLYAFPAPASLALDLYCGAGTVTLCMAGHCDLVVGAEIVSEAIENAKENARRNGIRNADFICTDAADLFQMIQSRYPSPDVVIVDPPRKGLSPEVIKGVSKLEPERLIYISCNPATLARDIRMLNEYCYQLMDGMAFDMFPRTSHIETVVLMIKK